MINISSLLLVAGTFLLSVLLTFILMSYVPSKGIMDIPNWRSAHFIPTPCGGGLAISITFIIASTTLFFMEYNISWSVYYALMLGSILTTLIGWFDDYMGIPSYTVRCLMHYLIVLLCLALVGVPNILMGNLEVSLDWVTYLLTTMILVWCLNLFNFMDGLDGLAAVQAITMLLSVAVIFIIVGDGKNLFPNLIILLVAISGFLIWNWPTAKIFMGDTGSNFLGLILGLFAVISAIDNSVYVWVWAILFGVFLMDTTITLIIRMLRKETWYKAHKQHAYQRLAMNIQATESVLMSPEKARAYAHRMISLAVAGINIFWLFPLALLAVFKPAWSILITIVAWSPLIWIVINVRNLGGRKGDSW